MSEFYITINFYSGRRECEVYDTWWAAERARGRWVDKPGVVCVNIREEKP